MTTSPRAAPVPFWNRLREISLYPFRGSSLIVLLLLTFGSLLGYLPGIGGILTLIVYASAYKFAFEILRSSADGENEPPENAVSVSDDVVWSMMGLLLVHFVVAAVAFWLGGPIVGLVVSVALTFLQPGCMMSLAMDGSLLHALNPATSLAVVARVGGPYFAVFGLLFVINASSVAAANWADSHMPPVIGQLGAMAFFLWGLFAAFHLMGYLIYQYHELLGYEPQAHARALPTLHDRDHALLEQAESHVREGRVDAAVALLRDEIRTRAVTPASHELYRRLLRQAGDARTANEHAALYLNLLMIEKQDRKALGLLREALDANPDFVPLQIEHGEQLAQRARLGGQAQLALDAWLALLRAQPRHANAARWGLDAAIVMVERGRDAEARVVLQQARAQASDAGLIEKIDAALKPLAA
jgi:tetratricopeptide (TPR) repeat protein